MSSTVTSADGTTIGYDRQGDGPPVILVDGALCYRASGPMAAVAALLAGSFTVYTYDRRGRGGSGDTPPYAVQREVEDIAALLREAGGAAGVFGISSGAVLALDAAARLRGITRLAVYEAPFVVDGTHPARPVDLPARMEALVAAGRRTAAVQLFLRTVGVPAVFVRLMRLLPVWSRLTAVAHTLPYDFRVLGDTGSGRPLPRDRWPVEVPVLSLAGGKSPQYMRNGMQALADLLPAAESRTLPGQTHMLKAAAIAPVVREFLAPVPATGAPQR